jgi:uncharacterized protein (DUF934 family)
MPLLKNGQVAADSWQAVADDAALPASGPVLVSFKRWQAERAELLRRSAPVGVRLSNTQKLSEVAPDLGHFDLVTLEFPKFVDGRAYTQARLLRERHGYRKELRATGNVLRDELQFMHRCGFDAFEIDAPDAVAQFRAAMAEIDVFYQPAADNITTVIGLRRSA